MQNVRCQRFHLFNPLTPTVATGTAIKHPVSDRVKSSFVIFDIRALWRLAVGVKGLTRYMRRLQNIDNMHDREIYDHLQKCQAAEGH